MDHPTYTPVDRFALVALCAYGAWAAYRGRSGAAAIATFGVLVAAALVAMVIYTAFSPNDWR
jgi:hypothetical protein